MRDINALYQQYIGDPRELPLIVAGVWGFGLQYYIQEGGNLYAVQDWIAGITNTKTPKAAEMWRQMKKQTRISITGLPYFTTSHKTYQRDFTDAHGLYIIAAHLRQTAERQALVEIKQYLAAAGVLVDEQRRDPDKSAQELEEFAVYQRLIKAGFTDSEARQWINQRAAGKVKRQTITEEWQRRGATERHFPLLTNQVTRVATGKTATEYKKALRIVSGSLRDYLSAAENACIGATEYFAAALHGVRDSNGYGELKEDIDDTKPIIDVARPEIEKAFSKKRPRRRQS